MALRIGIGTNLRIQGSNTNWNPLLPLGGEHVNFWASGRSGLTMPDSVGGNDVSILTPVFKGAASGSLSGTNGALERVFDGGSYTIYCKIKQLSDVVGFDKMFAMGNTTSNLDKGILLHHYGSIMYVTFCNGGGVQSETSWIPSNANAVLKMGSWIELLIQIDGVGKTITAKLINQATQVGIGVDKNIDISSWTLTESDNNSGIKFSSSNFASADFKKFTGIKTLAQCQDSSYVTDIQIYYPTLIDGTDVSGNAHHLTRTSITEANKYYSNISTYNLDYGYSLYRSTYKQLSPATPNFEDIYVPNNTSGVAIARTLNDDIPNARLKVFECQGSLTKHNMADSLLDIPVASWDRDDATIYEDVVRTSIYYDAVNPHRWHISELDYILFSQRCKTSNKGLNFFKVSDNSFATHERKYIDELFSFDTDKTGNNLHKILTYTKDQQKIDASILEYCDASVENSILREVRTKAGMPKVEFYWGDGTKNDQAPADTFGHVYSGVLTYPIYIINPESIEVLYVGTNLGIYQIAPLNADIGEYAKAVNMTSILIYWNASSKWTGNIDRFPLSLTRLYNVGIGGYRDDETGTIGGDVSRLVNLTYLYVSSGNILHGDISGLVRLTDIMICGDNTISGSIDNMSALKNCEGQGFSTLGGNFDNVRNTLELVCFAGNNTFAGDISRCVNLVYFQCFNPNIYGSVNLLVKLWSIALPITVTGEFSNLPLLEDIQGYGAMTKPSDFSANPKLQYLANFPSWTWTETQTNKILADLWANKDVVRTYGTYRTIYIHGTPAGQGLTDKAALQLYRSPTPPGTAALWTIVTD